MSTGDKPEPSQTQAHKRVCRGFGHRNHAVRTDLNIAVRVAKRQTGAVDADFAERANSCVLPSGVVAPLFD